jgi:divalent metal cation (Fe/Co/Zn/Cd) transporter
MAFGVESGMKLLAASVLLWQLAGEHAHGHVFAARAAQCVGQMRGGVLLALALSIMISAARGLWVHHGAAFSLLGLLLALCAIPLMWFLSTAKLRLAAAVGSRALRADAFESITYGCLSCVVVLGLSTAWVWHVWWVDNVTAVVIVYVLTLQRYLINSLA